MAEFPTVESFGLRREAENSKKDAEDYAMLFVGMHEWANQQNLATESQYLTVTFPDPQKSGLVGYTMHVDEQTLIVFDAFLVNQVTLVRDTEMRLWQIIINSWLTGGGTQPPGGRDGPRYVGFHTILQDETDAAMTSEVASQRGNGKVPPGEIVTAVEWTSESMHWLEAPFIRCAERIALELSTAARQIKVARAFIIPAKGEPYNLICEFAVTVVEAQAPPAT